MSKTPQTSFATHTHHLSLWEVAHRWTGYDPNESAPGKLPPAVKDALFSMMRAQANSALRVVAPNGKILKDRDYVDAENFRVDDENEWDGSEEHRYELYLELIDRITQRRDKLIADHGAILQNEKPITRAYFESIHVNQTDLARWAMKESLPFPEFWFSVDERKEFEQPSQPDHDQDLALLITKPNRLTEIDIDNFWQRLADKQRHRVLCRAVAEELWRKDKTLTIADIVKNPVIQGYCGGAYYTDPKTLRNWVSDLDPRLPEEKRGRPTKK